MLGDRESWQRSSTTGAVCIGHGCSCQQQCRLELLRAQLLLPMRRAGCFRVSPIWSLLGGSISPKPPIRPVERSLMMTPYRRLCITQHIHQTGLGSSPSSCSNVSHHLACIRDRDREIERRGEIWAIFGVFGGKRFEERDGQQRCCCVCFSFVLHMLGFSPSLSHSSSLLVHGDSSISAFWALNSAAAAQFQLVQQAVEITAVLLSSSWRLGVEKQSSVPLLHIMLVHHRPKKRKEEEDEDNDKQHKKKKSSLFQQRLCYIRKPRKKRGWWCKRWSCRVCGNCGWWYQILACHGFFHAQCRPRWVPCSVSLFLPPAECWDAGAMGFVLARRSLGCPSSSSKETWKQASVDAATRVLHHAVGGRLLLLHSSVVECWVLLRGVNFVLCWVFSVCSFLLPPKTLGSFGWSQEGVWFCVLQFGDHVVSFNGSWMLSATRVVIFLWALLLFQAQS